MRRTLALWLLLFAVYAATVGLSAFGNSDYGGDEPHYLLAAESIVEDGNVDVLDEYAERAYTELLSVQAAPPRAHDRGAAERAARRRLPLFIAPAYALGGATGVELFLAAIAALAMALAYRLALRVAPDPWALGAALAVGLSPPFLAYGSAVYPELTARRGARGRGAAGAAPPGAGDTAGRVRLLRAARRAAVARHEVRGGGGRDRRGRGTRRSGRGSGGRSRWVRWSSRCSRWRSTWRSTRRSTAAPLPTPRTSRARAPPTRAHRAATSSASTGWWPSSSTASTGCCAGRPCSCSAFVGLWWLWHSHRERLAQAVPGVREIELSAAPLRRCARRAAGGGRVRRADDVRLLVPAAPSAGRAAAGGPARGHGPAPHAAARASCSPRSRWQASAWLYADVAGATARS